MSTSPHKDPASWPYNLSVPGALMNAIERRMLEVQSGNLTRYVVELVAYDLRERHPHSLTGRLARKPIAVQHAVDLAISHHYKEGRRSNREQMDAVVKGAIREAKISGDLAPVKKEKHRVYLRTLHRHAMKVRLGELEFRHCSQYIVSLIRFDLLLGGPHKYFAGDDCDREMVASLDRATLAAFEANQPKKCLIDYLVEEAHGQKMSPEECNAALESVAEELCEQAVQAQNRARKSG